MPCSLPARPCAKSSTWFFVFLLAIGGTAAPAGAQPDHEEKIERKVVVRHKSAADAAQLVYPLLSEEGRVELAPGENSVVLRDRAEHVLRILAALEEFDRAGQLFRMEIKMVRAGAGTGAEPASGRLPADLLERLRQYLSYEVYWLEATSDFEVSAGERVRYSLGGRYSLAFRMGEPGRDGRVRLQDFRLSRGEGEDEPLIHAHVNLWIGKPMILGLARSEASKTALMVVLSCEEWSAELEAGEVSEPANGRSRRP